MPQSQTAANLRHQEEEKKWQKLTRTKQTKTNARAHRPAPSSPSELIAMLKGMKKDEDKEQGKTFKHEALRSINHKATQNKNHRLRTVSSRQLFHALIGNSQNYRSRGVVDDLMHCCPRQSCRGQQFIRSSTAPRERWFWLLPSKAWNSCFITQLVIVFLAKT